MKIRSVENVFCFGFSHFSRFPQSYPENTTRFLVNIGSCNLTFLGRKQKYTIRHLFSYHQVQTCWPKNRVFLQWQKGSFFSVLLYGLTFGGNFFPLSTFLKTNSSFFFCSKFFPIVVEPGNNNSIFRKSFTTFFFFLVKLRSSFKSSARRKIIDLPNWIRRRGRQTTLIYDT